MTNPQRQAIERHGRQLLAIFPRSTETDPVRLCKRLRQLEGKAHSIALQSCNGPEFGEGELEARRDLVMGEVYDLLGAHTVHVFLNRDARGYALKIDSEIVRLQELDIHKDWGGYGIIAPEIDKEGN